MRLSAKKFLFLAAVGLLACPSFGESIQTGQSSTDMSGNLQLQWLGKSAPGNILNAEIMLSLGMLPDTLAGRFAAKTSMARVSLDFHPPKILDITLSMPFLIKQGPDGFTGPFGDLSVDICKEWGKDENFLTALTVGLPTGFATIQQKNSILSGVTYLDPIDQPGNGLFDAQVRACYAFLQEWGFLNVGASYFAGLFAIRTSEYGYDTANQTISHPSMQFQVARDGLGATNDAGVRTPDRLSVFANLGIKTDMLMHCFAIGYTHSMESGLIYNLTPGATLNTYSTRDSAVASLHGNLDTTYQVVGEQSNSAWVYLAKTTTQVRSDPYLTIQYNVEKSDMAFPVFLGAMLRLDIDKSLMFGGLSVGLGFRFPVY